MIELQSDVLTFHKRFGVLIQPRPHLVPRETCDLRIGLIKEETGELFDAMMKGDLVKTADGIADSIYVLIGTAVSYGINLEEIWKEVHRSNMSKGEPEVIRGPNGKILKSRNWTPPNLRSLIDAQIFGDSKGLIFEAKPEEK